MIREMSSIIFCVVRVITVRLAPEMKSSNPRGRYLKPYRLPTQCYGCEKIYKLRILQQFPARLADNCHSWTGSTRPDIVYLTPWLQADLVTPGLELSNVTLGARLDTGRAKDLYRTPFRLPGSSK